MRASSKGRGPNFAKFSQNMEQSSNRKKLTLVSDIVKRRRLKVECRQAWLKIEAKFRTF